MKSYIRYSIVSCLLSLWMVSCGEDFLETPPVGAFTEDNYIQTVDDLETVLYSCYSIMNAYYSSGWPYANMGFQIFALGNVGSDDAEKGSYANDALELQEISMSNQTPFNMFVFMFWLINYDLIGKCNLVIDKAANIPVPEDEVGDVEQIVDEAKFLRALAYYQLVTLYGDIPLLLHWQDDPLDIKFERSPQAEIWDQIEQDLTDASNLPMRSMSKFGRATHGAVHALMGKVFLWQREYEKAAEAYDAIIKSGQYQLVDDYGLLHRYEGEDCTESIFEFQNEQGVDGGHVESWTGTFRLPRDYEAGGFGFDIPTQDLVDEFEPGDPRLLYTVTFIGDVFPAPWGEYVVENNHSVTGYTTRKAWVPWDERANDTWLVAINWRYCRYAEVLLYCAEALNELDQREDARTYLNKVRTRARDTPKVDPQRISTVWDSTYTNELLPNITTSDKVELREAIWHEQRVELAQEGHRRWTLLRTDRFRERMEAAKGSKGCIVEDHEWFLPIPGDEVETSEGRIKQNPGYN